MDKLFRTKEDAEAAALKHMGISWNFIAFVWQDAASLRWHVTRY